MEFEDEKQQAAVELITVAFASVSKTSLLRNQTCQNRNRSCDEVGEHGCLECWIERLVEQSGTAPHQTSSKIISCINLR